MEVEHLAKIYKALGDENRLRVLALIVQQGDVCVCEVSDTLGISQPLASKYLKQLRNAGIVAVSKKGKWSIYTLKENALLEPLVNFLCQIPLPPPKRCDRC